MCLSLVACAWRWPPRALFSARGLYSRSPPSKFRLAHFYVHCTELCRFLALASSLPIVSVLWLVSASALRRLSSLLYVFVYTLRLVSALRRLCLLLFLSSRGLLFCIRLCFCIRLYSAFARRLRLQQLNMRATKYLICNSIS